MHGGAVSGIDAACGVWVTSCAVCTDMLSCKESNREFARFLQIAAGSAAELHYHMRFATDAALVPRSVGDTLLAEITRMRKMLFLLLRRVREATPHSGHTPTTHDPRPEARRDELQTDDD